MSNKLEDLSLKDLKKFDSVYFEGELMDMDEFLDWVWSTEVDDFIWGIDRNEGKEVLFVR